MFDAAYPNPGAPPPERRGALRLFIGALLAVAGSAAAWPLLTRLNTSAGRPPPQMVDLGPILPGARVLDPAWLVVFGHCSYDATRLSGQDPKDERGIFGGWLCPNCRASYDLSGRPGPGPATRGPADPPYSFSGPDEIEIG